jgi:CO/xanthine dehydrogenase Mo-binding subunit
LDGEYFAVTIRSPAANCRLKGISCPVLDSDYKLIRACDIPGVNSLAGEALPLLAACTLRYIGEPVAIIAGPVREKVENLASEIVVETEPLSDTAPDVTEDDGESEQGGEAPVFSITRPDAEILAQVMLDMDCRPKTISVPRNGDEPAPPGEEAAEAPEAAEPAEPVRVSGCYRTGIQEHWYSEPHGALAEPVDGGIKVYAATQWPAHLRRSVGEALDMPVSAVLLEEAEIGLHFDGKIWYPSLVAAHAALAAFIMRKPVKLMLTREEDFLFSPKRVETLIDFSTLLDANGEPSETTIKIRAGFGAGGFFAGSMLDCIARAASENYRLGHIKVSAEAVKTNLPPACSFAGFGAAEGFFALERHAVMVADTARAESVEWREYHYNEKKIPAEELQKLTENLINRCDYRRKQAAYGLLRQHGRESGVKISPLRGIGISAFAHRDGRASLGFEHGGGAVLALKNRSKPPPLAAAVVELEIDEIDFSARVRGIWVSIRTGKISDKTRSRRMLLRNIICAFGWTAFEKLSYNEGRIAGGTHIEYNIQKPSGIPAINIVLSERDEKEENPEVIGELPYCVIPAAYTEALSQACDHHFQSIPVSARDIWRVLNGREQEARTEKEGGAEGPKT